MPSVSPFSVPTRHFFSSTFFFCTSPVTDAALAWQLARAVSLIHEMVPKVVMQNGDDPDGFFPLALSPSFCSCEALSQGLGFQFSIS